MANTLSDLVDRALSEADQQIKLASHKDAPDEESILFKLAADEEEGEEKKKKAPPFAASDDDDDDDDDEDSSEEEKTSGALAVKYAEALEHVARLWTKLASEGTSPLNAPGPEVMASPMNTSSDVRDSNTKATTVPANQASHGGGPDEQTQGNPNGIQTNKADYRDPEWTKNKEAARSVQNKLAAQFGVKIAADPSSPQANLDGARGENFKLDTAPGAASHIPDNAGMASMTQRKAKREFVRQGAGEHLSEPAFNAASDKGLSDNISQGLETSKMASARPSVIAKIANGDALEAMRAKQEEKKEEKVKSEEKSEEGRSEEESDKEKSASRVDKVMKALRGAGKDLRKGGKAVGKELRRTGRGAAEGAKDTAALAGAVARDAGEGIATSARGLGRAASTGGKAVDKAVRRVAGAATGSKNKNVQRAVGYGVPAAAALGTVGAAKAVAGSGSKEKSASARTLAAGAAGGAALGVTGAHIARKVMDKDNTQKEKGASASAVGGALGPLGGAAGGAVDAPEGRMTEGAVRGGAGAALGGAAGFRIGKQVGPSLTTNKRDREAAKKFRGQLRKAVESGKGRKVERVLRRGSNNPRVVRGGIRAMGGAALGSAALGAAGAHLATKGMRKDKTDKDRSSTKEKD